MDFHLVQQKNSGKIYKLAAHNETKIIKALDEMWKKFGKFSPEKSFTIAALAYDFLEQTITNSTEKGKNKNISFCVVYISYSFICNANFFRQYQRIEGFLPWKFIRG